MAEKVLTKYRLRLLTLSPLHIWSARPDLVQDSDFVARPREGIILVIDEDKMFDMAGDAALRHPQPTISRLLPQRPQQDACAAYRLAFRGHPQQLGRLQSLREHIKDGFAKPYLPGSSLKGAFRTALAWAQYRPPLDPRQLGEEKRGAREADEHLERQWFVPAPLAADLPHYDLLRALRVGDLYPAGGAGLEAVAVNTYSLRGERLVPRQQEAAFLEVFPQGTHLEGEMTVEDYLFSPRASELGLAAKRGLLAGLAQHGRAFAQDLIHKEAAFYAGRGLPLLESCYQGLRQELAGLKENQFLLQVAWGAGWRAKTVGTKLQPNEIKAVSERWRRRDGRLELERWQRGANFPRIFPKTRRLAEGPQGPEAPLGWVRIELVPQA